MVDFCFSTFDMGWRGWPLAAIGMEDANKEESKEMAGVVQEILLMNTGMLIQKRAKKGRC